MTRLDQVDTRAARDGFEISTDQARLDLEWLFAALSDRAYWAVGRSKETIRRSIDGSRCYGLYAGLAPGGDCPGRDRRRDVRLAV